MAGASVRKTAQLCLAGRETMQSQKPAKPHFTYRTNKH